MRILIALSLFIFSNLNAAEITISDFSKNYEHHFTNCTVTFHSDMNPEKYLYANCGSYAAPFIAEKPVGDYTSPVYDEIGINGVHWNGCKMVGDPLFEIKIECNVPFTMVTDFTPESWKPFWRRSLAYEFTMVDEVSYVIR